MSETAAPIPAAPIADATPAAPPPTVPVTLASGSVPAIGATAPEPEGTSTAGAEPAPASSSSETPGDTSILSGATGGAPAAEPAVEPTAKEPTETAASDAPAEPAPPPTYEAFKLPDGVQVDDTKLPVFTGLLGEYEARAAADPTKIHAVFQELGQKLVDMHISQAQEMGSRLTQSQVEAWNQRREDWKSEFRADRELGGNRQETTLRRLGDLMNAYGNAAGEENLVALREAFNETGAGDRLAVLRFANWAARRLTETSRPVMPMIQRSPNPGAGKADRLYRNSIGNNGAS